MSNLRQNGFEINFFIELSIKPCESEFFCPLEGFNIFLFFELTGNLWDINGNPRKKILRYLLSWKVLLICRVSSRRGNPQSLLRPISFFFEIGMEGMRHNTEKIRVLRVRYAKTNAVYIFVAYSYVRTSISII